MANKKVLIVDDEEEIVAFMGRFLKKMILYVLVESICLSYFGCTLFASGDEREKDVGHSRGARLYYTQNGLPLVRRQFFPEDEPGQYSSLKKTIRQRQYGTRTIPKKQGKILPPKIDMKNLVIFLRFKGEPEFISDENRQLFVDHYNGDKISLKSYMKDVSYGQFNVESDFFPIGKDQKFYSYESQHSRDYYRPWGANNCQGYKSSKSANKREFNLLCEGISYCRDMIEKKHINEDDLDFNEDGKIDNVIFVVSGSEDTWDDLLWPHQFVIPDDFDEYHDAVINGKRVSVYNLTLQSCNLNHH